MIVFALKFLLFGTMGVACSGESVKSMTESGVTLEVGRFGDTKLLIGEGGRGGCTLMVTNKSVILQRHSDALEENIRTDAAVAVERLHMKVRAMMSVACRMPCWQRHSVRRERNPVVLGGGRRPCVDSNIYKAIFLYKRADHAVTPHFCGAKHHVLRPDSPS